MKLIFKTTVTVLLIMVSTLSTQAFSLLGPSMPEGNAAKDWQIPNWAYNLTGDLGGPMTPLEGYRLTIPTLTYAFDQSFVHYFGSNGMAAVDRAIDILNDLLTNGVSMVTHDGTRLFFADGRRIPFDTRFRNFEFATLGLRDVKSHALGYLLEQMGLENPERWVWAIAGRGTSSNPPFTNYTVARFNYDPITIRPSSVVNGVAYTYRIFEFQNPPPLVDAIEFADPLEINAFSSVAGFRRNLFSGTFYAGLTHDDVGGLRWLYNTNNIVVESLLTNQVTGGRGVGGSSPWAPFLGLTNFFFGGTNIFNTNTLIVTGLRPGANVMRFEKVAFDSIIGQTFIPITNRYTDTTISNALPVIQPVQRVISFPDFLFSVEDLGTVGGSPFIATRTDTANWINNDLINGNSELGGPGIILPPREITFTSLFPVYLNQNPGFEDEMFNTGILIWATFDETVDEPILYPAYGDLTLDDLRDIVLGRRRN
jgi:hypothetical protein